MKDAERIISLHERMDHIRHRQELRKTGTLGSASVILAVYLFLLIFNAGESNLGVAAGMYSGTTMLFDGAGGYVLAAVIAFMAGVIVTVMIIRNRKMK